MSDKAYKTQGTHLYFVDTVTASAAAVAVTCPTGVTGLNNGTKDRIDITCLDNTTGVRSYASGFADAGEATVPFILMHDDASHEILFDLNKSGETVGWLVGFSNNTTEPTLGSDDSLVPPNDRSTVEFRGYVSGVTIDIGTNEVVRGTLTIQQEGTATYTSRGPAPV